MLRIILAFLTIGLLLVSQAAAQQVTPFAGRVTVPRRKVLTFATLQALDSTVARVGDDVPLRLVSPLIVDGVVLLPAGEVVHGRVTKVKRAGPEGRNGRVEWKLDRIKFADGTTAKVTVGYISNLSNWDAFWLTVILAPFLPFYLFDVAFGDHGPKKPHTRAPGKEFLLPAYSEVPISIAKDHHVRF
jgi:hypothetical protein